MKYLNADEEHERAAVESLCELESGTKVALEDHLTETSPNGEARNILNIETLNGGADETRTRDLLRDRQAF